MHPMLPRSDALEFLRLLWAIDHGLQQRSKRMAHELGVTGVQRFVIRVVQEHPSITPGQLADVLHLHPSTLTGVIQRLERRGFVARRADGSDRRRLHLALTARGRAIERKRDGTVEAELEKVLARLQPDEVRAAQKALAAIGDRLAVLRHRSH